MATPPKDKTSKAAKIVLIVGIVLIIVMALTLLFWDSSPPSRPKAPPTPIAPAVKSEPAVQDIPMSASENPPEIYLESTDTLKLSLSF